MRKEDFRDIDVLQACITHRKPRAPYSFQDARSFELRANFPEGYLLRMDYSNAPLASVRLMKGQGRYRRQLFDLSATDLPGKYPQFRQLQPGKVEHLKQLLDYIPPRERFYLDFVIDQQATLAADARRGDEDEDHLDYDDSDSDSDEDVDDPRPIQEWPPKHHRSSSSNNNNNIYYNNIYLQLYYFNNNYNTSNLHSFYCYYNYTNHSYGDKDNNNNYNSVYNHTTTTATTD